MESQSRGKCNAILPEMIMSLILKYLSVSRTCFIEFLLFLSTILRLELRPHTGRTHQLRVHCSQGLGAPIVGDDIYGNGGTQGYSTLCLHAQKLCFYHPISGAPMIFEADAPF